MSDSLARRRMAARCPMLFGTWEAIGIGLAAIRAYKLRAGLTILGVVMGIMTVTGMSSIVAGLNASMATQIESLGSSVIFVRPLAPGREPDRRGAPPAAGPHRDEVEAIAEQLPLGEARSRPWSCSSPTPIKSGNAAACRRDHASAPPRPTTTVHDALRRAGPLPVSRPT